MAGGAKPGNRNAAKSAEDKPWASAILRQMKQNPAKLNAIALKLLDMAAEGDVAAIREMGDRVDGKPKQAIDATGNVSLTVQVMRFSDVLRELSDDDTPAA